MRSIAIFGGTFDPVHNGHLLISLSIQSSFNFDSYYFLPCKIPIIKSPASASNQQRVEMLQLAIKNYSKFKLDLREITRDSPSYMVDTLRSFQKEHESDSITLIMGFDAFLSLPQWHQWHHIIKLANILVINRNQFSNYPIPEPIKNILAIHQTEIKDELLSQKSGAIYLFNAGNYEISSTAIREKLKKDETIASSIPKDVYEYIKTWELYQ